MNTPDDDRICAYCANRPGPEDDHVIARQFLPNEFVYRHNLPQAPACGICNRLKQKYEDSAGVILHFGHDSDASRKVLEQRVPKTLKKNARLLRALQSGMHWEWLRDKSGIFQQRLVIDINAEEVFYINLWFRFITRGLYHSETKEPLPADYKVYLIKPATQTEFDDWTGFILNTRGAQEKELGNGEFRYLFARSPEDHAFTMWLFVFKSVEVFAFTLSPDTPNSLVSRMEQANWTQPDPKKKSARRDGIKDSNADISHPG